MLLLAAFYADEHSVKFNKTQLKVEREPFLYRFYLFSSDFVTLDIIIIIIKRNLFRMIDQNIDSMVKKNLMLFLKLIRIVCFSCRMKKFKMCHPHCQFVSYPETDDAL